MRKIRITIDNVVGQRLHTYQYSQTYPAAYRALVLFEVSHVLSLNLDNEAVEFIELSPDEQRLRLSTADAKATLNGEFFNFITDNGTITFKWRCSLNGTVILTRIKKNEYRVELGVLEVSDLPYTNSDLHDLLAALWPTDTGPKESWMHLWTPMGLGIESELSFNGKTELRRLLLPRWQSTPSAVAWYGETCNLEIAELEKRPDNAQRAVKELLSAELPGGGNWMGNHAGTARRWLILSNDNSIGLVTEAFGSFADSAFLTITRRLAQVYHPKAPDTELDDPAVVAEFWAATDYRKKLQPKHRGLVITLLQETLQATLTWNERGNLSVFNAERAHASYKQIKGPRFERVHLTLIRGSEKNSGAPLQIKFQPHPVLGTLGAVPMQPVTVSPISANQIVSAVETPRLPRWLAVDEGWLDLGAWPSEETNAASAWLDLVSGAERSLLGNVPLGELNGPEGLTAVVPEVGSMPSGSPGVRLRLTRQDATLELFNATFIWRTPAWWVLDQSESIGPGSPDLPNLAPAFTKRFNAADDTLDSATRSLSAAISEVFRSTLWVGHADLEVSSSWILFKKDSDTTLTLPAARSKDAIAWVIIPNAYMLATTPHRGSSVSSLILDGTRALTRLTSPRAPIAFKINPRHLPSFAKHPFPDLEHPPAEWTAEGGEMFHPHIFGLGYLPKDQRFQYRHGSLMAAEGFLRENLDGSLDGHASNDLLDTVRPVDDVAIFTKDQSPVFSLIKGSAKDLIVTGWVPCKDVIVNSIQVQYTRRDGRDPQLVMVVGTGKEGETPQTIEISPTSNGFLTGMTIKVSDDGKDFWIEAQQDDTFRLFGHQLLVATDHKWFADGTGKRWEPFRQGARRTWNDGNSVDRFSHTAYAILKLAGSSSEGLLGISLLDLAAGQPEIGSSWDLVGNLDRQGFPMAPQLGPFPLFAGSLKKIDRQSIEASIKIGVPFVSRDQSLESSAGEVITTWTGAFCEDWSIEGHGSFDWTLPAVQPPSGPGIKSNLTLRRVEGSVVIVDGNVRLSLSAVTVFSPLGPLRFKTQPTPITVHTDEDGQHKIEISIKSETDPTSGFECTMVARCPLNSGELQWGIDEGAELGWSSPRLRVPKDGASSIEVNDFIVHPAAEPWNFKLTPHQSSVCRWGMVHVTDGNDPVPSALAVSIQVLYGGKTPVLQWTVRASVRLDPSILFGAILTDQSEVRADLHMVCEGLFDNNLHVGSTISGYVTWNNDVSYKTSTGVYNHKVRLIFDELPLTATGELPQPFYAVGDHSFYDGDKIEQLHFQSVHRLNPVREGNQVWVQCMALQLLTGAPPLPPLAPQVHLHGDTDIAIARAPQLADSVSGHVLRLALRNKGCPVEVRVPPPSNGAALQWFPRLQLPTAKPSLLTGRDVWHERGAMADLICPEGLEPFGKLQQETAFANGAFPQDGEEFKEWSSIFNKGTYLAGSLVSAAGVVVLPFLVGVAKWKATPEDVTQPKEALRVDLLTVEPYGVRRALSSMASALVNVAQPEQDTALTQWAKEELKRQSSRGAAIVIVRGDPSGSLMIPRSFHSSAVSDIEVPTALPIEPDIPAVSHLAQASESEDPTGWRSRLLVASAPHNVLEAVSSRPVGDGPETGRTTSLVTAAALESTATYDRSGGAIGLRQSVNFKEGGTEQRLRWPSYRVHPMAPLGSSWTTVVPPLLHATEWALRPGDMLHSSFGMVESSSILGPPLEIELRTARPQPLSLLPELHIAPWAGAHCDGVNWLLHRVRTQREVGKPFQKPIDRPLLTVVTSRETLHALPDIDLRNKKGPDLVVGCRVRTSKMNESGVRVWGYTLEEPLLVGAFQPSSGPLNTDFELAIVKGIPEQDIPNAREIEALLLNPAQWRKEQEKIDCIILRSLGPLLDAGQLNLPTSYYSGPARLLQSLIEITDIPEVENSRTSPTTKGPFPWLFSKEEATRPALALVSVDQRSGSRRVIVALPITWLESRPSDQPERLVVIANDRVIGYGDMAGKSSLDIEHESFLLRTTCVALQHGISSDIKEIQTWRFAPSGVCTGTATVSNRADVRGQQLLSDAEISDDSILQK